MYKIDNATAVTSIPTPAAVGPNANGFFTGGNPALGVDATSVDADWLNAVQEELSNAITAAGITLSKTTRTQLRDAIKFLVQQGAGIYVASTTDANTYTATLSPAPTAYTEGMFAFVKFTNHNTGAATINFNSLGAKNIKKLDGSALASSDIADGMVALLVYDGTNFQLVGINPANYVTQTQSLTNANRYAADSGSANAYAVTLSPVPTAYTTGMEILMKVTNTNTSGSCTVNVNSLGTKNIKLGNGANINIGDLYAGHIARLVYDGTNFQLLNPVMVVKNIVRQVFTSSGTYTPTAGMMYCDIMVIGSGAGGGGAAATSSTQGAAAGGGGGGEMAIGRFTAAQVGASQSVTVGAAGTAGAAGNNNGGNGNTSSVGSLITAVGGAQGAGSGTVASTSIANSAGGGAGGGILSAGTGGDWRSSGSYGSNGFVWNLVASAGVLSLSGSGGGSPVAPPNIVGAPPGFLTTGAYGNGGGGAANGISQSALAGHVGSQGVVVILEYCNQ